MQYSDYITKSITKHNVLEGDMTLYGEVVLKYAVTYPFVTVNRQTVPQRFINQSYRMYAENAKRHILNTYYAKACQLKRSLAPEDFCPLNVECEMSIMYENRGFLSVFFDTYERLGETVLKTARHSDTWSLAIGKTLPLGSFFHMGCRFTQIIMDNIARQIEGQIELGTGTYFRDWREILPKRINFQNYYLADDGIVLYFAEYQIAAKSVGIPSFLIPYSVFGSGLKYDL